MRVGGSAGLVERGRDASDAAGKSGSFPETSAALDLLDRLWAMLLQDLANVDNTLPEDLRAD